jgi:hypothetical protein
VSTGTPEVSKVAGKFLLFFSFLFFKFFSCVSTGTLEVSKVAGNFHFAPGKKFSQMGINLDRALIEP